MVNQQSAARSTPNKKQHKLICQLRTNTTASSRPANGQNSNRGRHHSNNKARLPHRLYFPKEFCRGKEPPADAIPGRMHATVFFRGYRLLLLIRPSCGAACLKERFFPLLFISKVSSCFLVHPLHAIRQTKSVCVIEHSYSYLYVLNEYKLCRCGRTRIIPPSRPGTQSLVMLLCGSSGAVIVITTSSF